MTHEFALRSLLTGAALCATICVYPVTEASAQGYGAKMAGSTSATAVEEAEQRALEAITQARNAAKQHKVHDTIAAIDRAETALLNLEQVPPRDPHIDVALKQLDAARDAASRKDIAATEQQLAEAANLMTVASSATAPPAASAGSSTPPEGAATNMSMTPDQAHAMMGQQVYDVNNVDIGPVTDIVLEDDGTPAAIIIGVAGPADGGATSVTAPITDLRSVNNQISVRRTKEQLRQAASYRTQN